MEFFLLNLSYSTQGWADIVAENAGFDRRLQPVRNLIARLGGSFANFHFHDREPFKRDAPVVVQDKFAHFDGNDLLAVLTFPSKEAAYAFSVTLRSFPHIENVRLTALMPFENAIETSVPTVATVLGAGEFQGPNQAPKAP